MKKIINTPVKDIKPLIDVDFNPYQRLTAKDSKGKKVGTFRIIKLAIETPTTQYFHCVCEKCGYEDYLKLYEIHTPYCLENN